MPTMNFTSGDDSYVASPSPTAADLLILNFLAGSDRLRTTSGVTEAHMGDGNDYVRIDPNCRATVFGDAGADRFDMYSRGNSIDGGGGNDVFNIADSFPTLEYLKGGDGADRFNFMTDLPWIGGAFNSSIDGGDGNDVFVGYGHDIGIVHGGAGDDFFTGMGSLHSGDLTGAYGGTGNDTFRVAPGLGSAYPAPVLFENPGEGIDTVQVAYGASYTLPDNVENLRALNFATVNEGALLTGNGLANRIMGGTLAETLSGLGGDDWIEGGAGQDRLYGGAGADRFVFRNGDFGGATTATADHIYDFNQAEHDRIALNLVDANLTLSGDQAFAFIGTEAFSHHAGELRYVQMSGETYVSGDTDGDGVADFMIHVAGLHTLSASDFAL